MPLVVEDGVLSSPSVTSRIPALAAAKNAKKKEGCPSCRQPRHRGTDYGLAKRIIANLSAADLKFIKDQLKVTQLEVTYVAPGKQAVRVVM